MHLSATYTPRHILGLCISMIVVAGCNPWCLHTVLSLFICAIATAGSSSLHRDVFNLTDDNHITRFQCKRPPSPDLQLPYEPCRDVASRFQQIFDHDPDIALTHATIPVEGLIPCPYTITNEGCVFRLDFQGNLDPHILPSSISMWGIQLARRCRGPRRGGGGSVVVRKDSFYGPYYLVVWLEYPERADQKGNESAYSVAYRKEAASRGVELG